MVKKMTAGMLTFMGFLFLTAYIRSAATGVVYTDYLRIVSSYLEDVTDFTPMLHADILTRIPVNYIGRIVNVKLFGYTAMFDMLLGAAGLAFCAAVILSWCAKRKMRLAAMLVPAFLIFSLDKWEMLTNGTGWVHFWAVGFFYYHFTVYDRVRNGEAKKGDRRRLVLLPVLTTLLLSGPYCAAYLGAVAAVYLLDYFTGAFRHPERNGASFLPEEKAGKTGLPDKKAASAERKTAAAEQKDFLLRMAAVIVPFILYYISRACSVEEYAGASDMGFFEMLGTNFAGFLEFAVRSFAGLVIGGETAEQFGIPSGVLILLGIVVIAAYLFALFLNFKEGLTRRTVLPLLLIVMALMSHALIIFSRWIFLDPAYGMSSRYALQYMSGSLGILLTFFLCGARRQECSTDRRPMVDSSSASAGVSGKGSASRKETTEKKLCPGIIAAAAFTILLLAGQLVTTGREIDMAKYRKEYFLMMEDTARNYRNENDAALKKILQYHDPARTRKALEILEKQNLNVFRESGL